MESKHTHGTLLMLDVEVVSATELTPVNLSSLLANSHTYMNQEG
jgi:hypothetical protein